MNKPEYLLQHFGVSAHSLQHGITVQTTECVAVKVKELSQLGHISCLIDIANKLLTVVEDVKYSPIWVVMLDGLSHFSHQEDVQAIYHQLMEKQAKILITDAGSLHGDILHKLWLSHLPCLESTVITLVEHVCSDQYLPHTAIIRDLLVKSLLVEIASREHIIYQTVYRMLMTMIISSDFAMVMVEITANFYYMVRHMMSKLTFQNQLMNTSGVRRNTKRLESLLRLNSDPQTIPTASVVDTIYKLHKLWTKDKQKAAGVSEPSEDITDLQFEELWCVTVEYRNWISAALSVILSCDEQYVESCLWFIAAHHRLNLSSQKLKPLEDVLTSFVKGLRDHLCTPFLRSEHASQITRLATETYHTLESKSLQFMDKKETHQRIIVASKSVVNQILMTFFFQSDGCSTIGDELLTLVTSSKDACVHVRCIIYHYHLLNVTTQQWNSVRCDRFISLIGDLHLRLQNENTVNKIPDFVHLHSELKSILPVCQ